LRFQAGSSHNCHVRAVFHVGVAVLALSLLGSAAVAPTLRNLESCLTQYKDDGTLRSCCKRPKHDQLSRQGRGCCSPTGSDFGDPSVSPSASPDVGPCPAVALPLVAWIGDRASRDQDRYWLQMRDKPPDRAPPTATTVILI